ncbi:MAG: replicative DNA helicase [Pseudomonadota bacterium]
MALPEKVAPETSDEIENPPYNIEAEQALLGAILFDNEVYFKVSDYLQSDHFYEPLHARLYEAMAKIIGQNRVASPITLKDYFANDPAIKDELGQDYLAYLASAAPTTISAPEYGRTVFELNMRRGLMRLGQDMAGRAAQSEIDDGPNLQIQDAEKELYALAETGKYGGGFKSFKDSLMEAIEAANAAYKREGGLSGVTTGLLDLDQRLGGLHPSDLIILAGRPSMGKTSLATNIAVNAAVAHKMERQEDGSMKTVEGAVVAFFSLEMSADQLANRVMAEWAEVSSHKIRRGEITQDEFEKIYDANKRLQNLPLHIDDTGGLSIAALASRARRLKRQKGLGLIVVDYLQLVTASNRRSDGRVQEVSEITQGLKALAKELNVPIIALSQLSRQVEARDDKRPQLSDLRESGSIEQDADVVMFVYREEYYVKRTQPREGTEEHFKWQSEMDAVRGLAECIIGKQRHGPIGTVKMRFEESLTKFSNLDEHHHPNY